MHLLICFFVTDFARKNTDPGVFVHIYVFSLSCPQHRRKLVSYLEQILLTLNTRLSQL